MKYTKEIANLIKAKLVQTKVFKSQGFTDYFNIGCSSGTKLTVKESMYSKKEFLDYPQTQLKDLSKYMEIKERQEPKEKVEPKMESQIEGAEKEHSIKFEPVDSFPYGPFGSHGLVFPSFPREGRLDALDYTQKNFPAPGKGGEIQVGHVVGRGIQQFTDSLLVGKDLASGSIGKHYREDVPELMKLKAAEQNLALLACVETVHWNQESQLTGNKLGSSMSATERFAILNNARNLDNEPPSKVSGMLAGNKALFRLDNAWEGVANTASLKPETAKLFESISNEVTQMAALFPKEGGGVDVKALADAVTECAKVSGDDPKLLLKNLQEKNDALNEQAMKTGGPEKEVTLEKAKAMKLESGKTLGSAMGKPFVVDKLKYSVDLSHHY